MTSKYIYITLNYIYNYIESYLELNFDETNHRILINYPPKLQRHSQEMYNEINDDIDDLAYWMTNENIPKSIYIKNRDGDYYYLYFEQQTPDSQYIMKYRVKKNTDIMNNLRLNMYQNYTKKDGIKNISTFKEELKIISF